MKSVNRRDFLKLSGSTLIGLTLGGIALRASAQERLQPDEPSAKALKYTHSSPVNGEVCGNCMYIQGQEGGEYRPCAIFPGKSVNVRGWCSAWVKQPG